MKKLIIFDVLFVAVTVLFSLSVSAQQAPIKITMAPIPASEANLPVITAEPWLKLDNDPKVFLEGPAFDREGNLYITSVEEGRIIKVTPDGKISNIFQKKGVLTDGLAIHKDGRLFVACISGELLSMDLNGGNVTNIDVKYQGKPKQLNDLTFDSKGNLYVSDFGGTFFNPVGGIYRYSADFKTVTPVIERFAGGNGVGFSPDGNTLWATQTGTNELVRLSLGPDGSVRSAGIAYRFTGSPGGCDSLKVDSKGNIYVCLVRAGRCIIFSPNGIPIAQVLIPGRDEGRYSGTANLVFKPGTNEVYVTAFGPDGVWVYKFKGLAEGAKLFSHQ